MELVTILAFLTLSSLAVLFAASWLKLPDPDLFLVWMANGLVLILAMSLYRKFRRSGSTEVTEL